MGGAGAGAKGLEGPRAWRGEVGYETEDRAGGSCGEGILTRAGDTITGGADMGGGEVLSLVGEASRWAAESFRSSAANSWASLDFFPTLPKGLMTIPEEEREEEEEPGEAASPSVFSRFRELDR